MSLRLNITVAAALLAALGLLLAVCPTRAAERCGTASFYGAAHHGKLMANQRPFNMHAMTAAMWDVPFGSEYRVVNQRNGKSVRVTITDRGPARRLNRIIDLSQAAFARIAPLGQGTAKVCIERLS